MLKFSKGNNNNNKSLVVMNFSAPVVINLRLEKNVKK